MTLYVESNFVLELALNQEESVAAERLLSAAEAGLIEIALPSISLSEPFSRITSGKRERTKVTSQLNAAARQLSRSAFHQADTEEIRNIPAVMARIDQREQRQLIDTVRRLLPVARCIELRSDSFEKAVRIQSQYDIGMEDSIVLAVVLGDLQSSSSTGHLFANRNKQDFNDPGILRDLRQPDCRTAWTFSEAARLLGIH